MGLPKQEVPVVDYESSSKGTRAGKIVPIAQHWAEVGFGTPVILHLFYVVKILLYVLVAWLVVLGTSGIDGFTDASSWRAEPIAYQKVILFTMLFEVVGLGCGFRPLNNRFLPSGGSILYWLRPNTALHSRCHFEPDEARVLLLDAQPIHRQTQDYRLVDAATGEFERGVVRVADMVTRQPWDDEVPVTVTWSDRLKA